jgi:XTP/dITP diphosphohydrolase
MELVMASANPHKVAEIDGLLAMLLPGVSVIPRPSWVGEVIEDADTLIGNARLKAQALVAATGQAAIADDTGLFVDAIGDLPGVHTARYAGHNATATANNDLLLSELKRVGAMRESDRIAAFRTVALVAFPNGREISAIGEVVGNIALTPYGAGGFGYDPIFIPSGFTQTFAEMSATEKQSTSHRARAFGQLAALMREELGWE